MDITSLRLPSQLHSLFLYRTKSSHWNLVRRSKSKSVTIPFDILIFIIYQKINKRPFSCEFDSIHYFCRYDDVLFRPKASIRWEIVSTKVRNRRDVIFSFADFVGSFGGAAALFLGVNFWHFAVVCLKILEKLVQLFRRREQNS